MTLRKTMLWFLSLVLLLGLAGGTYGFWLWNQSDELLREGILTGIKNAAPDWSVEIQRARINWLSRRHIHLYDVEIKGKEQTAPFVVLPEMILTIDRERFEASQQIDVLHVKLRGPTVDFVRGADGVWNWQKLPKLPHSERSLPEVEIEDGIVRIQVTQSDASGSALISLTQANVDLIPSGKREFRIRGATQIQDAGILHFDADWDVDAKAWSANGRIHDVTTSGELTALAASLSPHLRSRLQQADAALRRMAHLPPRPVAGADAAADLPDFGVGGTLNIDFRASRVPTDASPKFALAVDVRQGHVTNPALPFPLHDLTGRLGWDNDRLEVQQVTVRYGQTRLTVDGHIERQADSTPARFDLSLNDVELSDQLRDKMPESWQRIYNSLRPAGNLNAHVVLDYDGHGSLRYQDLVISARNCTCKHTKFAYPVRSVAGTIKQEEWGLQVDFKGLASGRPVTVEGKIKNPGQPTSEAKFEIDVKELPLNETFVAACDEQQQKLIASLGLRGLADGHCTVSKPPGEGQKYDLRIHANVWDGALEFERFKWPLEHLRGQVDYDSATQVWKFSNLEAHHDAGVVRGNATFSHPVAGDRGLLALDLTAQHANLDDDLERALPPNLRAIWAKLAPTGLVDLDASIRWVPGNRFAISFPRAAVSKGSLNLQPFPLPLRNVQAKLSYKDSIVQFESFTAKQGTSQVGIAKGQATWNAQGDWWIRLENLHANDQVADANSDLRRAFKEKSGLRRLVDQLNPQGPVSVAANLLEFHGTTSRPDVMTAAWDMEFVLSRNSLSVGTELKNVSGKVTARGTLDKNGIVTMIDGNRIDLDHAEVMGFSFSEIHGPYRLTDKQLTIGSPAVFAPQTASRRSQPQAIPLKSRMTARAIDGELTFDADAVLQSVPSYRMRITLAGGSLGEFSRQYMSSVSNLQGVMDGWIDLAGRGTSRDAIIGKGQLRISNAALYELPVLAQIFNVIKFAPPERTAFRYAMADFDVAHEQFDLKKVDLDGNTIRLLGKGHVRFDGALNLEFVSMPSRQNRTILDFVMNEATRGWLGVTVSGYANNPRANVRAVPQLDDALKQFIRAFDMRPAGGIPRLMTPQFMPYQLGPPPVDARRTYR